MNGNSDNVGIVIVSHSPLVARGAYLHLRASGAEAEAALAALEALIRRDFDEGHAVGADAAP